MNRLAPIGNDVPSYWQDMTNEQWSWLLLEGVTPLFGAGGMFALWGACKWVTTPNKRRFDYAWNESLDAMGWLYGALVIAVQAAIRFFNATPPQTLGTVYELVAGGCCLGLLLNGMDKRGQSRRWYPPNSMKILSITLAIGILAGGCYARGLSQREPPSKHPLAPSLTGQGGIGHAPAPSRNPR